MKPPPKGCDQQGRYPEAAHAATEYGMEDDDTGPNPVWSRVCEALIAVTLFAAVVVLLLGVTQ